jgi:hypothetical protein
MSAFGLVPSDWDANHQLMMAFDQFGYGEAALRFAKRTLSLRPDDSDAERVLDKWTRSEPVPGVTVPIPHD